MKITIIFVVGFSYLCGVFGGLKYFPVYILPIIIFALIDNLKNINE